MKSRSPVAARVNAETKSALCRLADLKGMSLSVAAESFLPGSKWADLLAAEHADDPDYKAPGDPLWTLAHEGLRWRLARLGLPMNEVERLTPPEVVKLYEQTRAARNGAVQRIRLADMLRGLRSADGDERGAAAVLLAAALGRGCRETEHEADVEHLIWPELESLLERAVDGDVDAVDVLEKNISTTPAGA